MGKRLPKLLRHITALRVICVAVVVFFSTSSIAKETTTSYKSKTADECVFEKECVWHHFLLGMQKSPIHESPSADTVIKKWRKPIRLRVTGTADKEAIRLTDKYINQLAPFILQDISLNQQYNYLILFTDSIERVLAGEFNSTFEKMYGENVVLNDYRSFTETERKECHYGHVLDLKNGASIYLNFSFIQEPNSNIQKCLRDSIYASTGMEAISYSPLLQDHRQSEKYTNLEKLLVYFLYQDFFTGGMTNDQAKKVFDKIYKSLIKKAIEQGVLDANR